MILGERVTRTTLADGRELIYFDDPGGPPRDPASAVDLRPLGEAVPAGTRRLDPLTGE